ncbi:MAG: hypothetical protein DME04_10945 [Candidatus Rokuibacteriota bacterium]|nr:MAG: hypothetical protein DME04_10945 [Candidatus Rokubacteria bacterium]
MAQPLEGTFSAEHSARLLRNYRYVVERTMRALGGWIALTPELSAKLLMGRHVWDLAQHCDAFGRRLPELRAHAHESEPANPAVATFMDALEEPEAPDQTVERLVGVYSVLKPHLLATYRGHLARANPVYEPPTRRILTRCIEDETKHVVAGEEILRHLASTPAAKERARVRQARLDGLLTSAGGVVGDGMRLLLSTPVEPLRSDLSDDAREFIRLEAATAAWPVPEGLGDALTAFAAALVARDTDALSRWLAPGVAIGDAARENLHAAEYTGHRVVAFARLGHQHLVKTRLDGSAGSVVVLSRWTSAGDHWRVAALDVVGRDLRPA